MSPRNEPDLNSPCITYRSWLEVYTLQSQAIQNAYSDLNADVATQVLACPVRACPFTPIIYASAFAAGTFGGVSTSSLGTSPYNSTYSTDYYAYMGQMTVANERTSFPPWPNTPQANNLQNLNAFSLHSYGKTGLELQQLGNTTTLNVTLTRPAAAPTSSALGFAVTEHNAHTTAQWNTLATNGDTNFEASRLAAQILFVAQNGWESYIFKLSTMEQSRTINPTCTTGSTTNPCGAQKTGIHWCAESRRIHAPFFPLAWRSPGRRQPAQSAGLAPLRLSARCWMILTRNALLSRSLPIAGARTTTPRTASGTRRSWARLPASSSAQWRAGTPSRPPRASTRVPTLGRTLGASRGTCRRRSPS